ncbi:MAG: hypothetical protein Q8P81_01035 [Nanoarchaeota archaeon]|nr:hypothetical protein [Nanoarchaeota archaeon]
MVKKSSKRSGKKQVKRLLKDPIIKDFVEEEKGILGETLQKVWTRIGKKLGLDKNPKKASKNKTKKKR